MFFYPNKSGALVLDFLDARTTENKKINTQECFNRVITANANKGNTR